MQMPNRGAFLGSRLDFMHAQNSLYAAAVVANTKDECVANIQRRYFKRYPIDLEHNVEPTLEFLDSIDDDEADPEVVAPDPDLLSPEEFKEAMDVFAVRQEQLVFRKKVSRLSVIVTRMSRVLHLVRLAYLLFL